MPELPEVETTKISLTPLLNKTVSAVHTSSHRLREPIPDLSELVGYKLVSTERRAKYLLLKFKKTNHTKTLLIHLGMSGSLGQYQTAQYRKHDHVIFEFGDKVLHYHDPRRFGMVIWADNANKYLAKLGIEPLSDEFTGDYLYHTIHKNSARPTARPIKTVIMEQAIVVGIGNIYAAESLFLSHIHPATPANILNKDELDVLVKHIKEILARAIRVGGSSLRDFSVGDNQTGYFQQTLLAYGRADEPCVNCHLPLENIKLTGRASVFCPSCQPFRTTIKN